MGICTGNPIASVTKGQTLRLHTIYNMPEGHPAIDDAMGIMIAYFG
jgi:hypothetical protein